MKNRDEGKPGHQIETELIAKSLEHPMTVRCMLCGWTFIGLAGAGIEAHKAHRRVEHGLTKRRKLRDPRYGAPSFVAGADLEANLERTRAAGGGVGSERQRVKEQRAGRVLCRWDGCRNDPITLHGRFAGLCHEHKLATTRKGGTS